MPYTSSVLVVVSLTPVGGLYILCMLMTTMDLIPRKKNIIAYIHMKFCMEPRLGISCFRQGLKGAPSQTKFLVLLLLLFVCFYFKMEIYRQKRNVSREEKIVRKEMC